MLAAMTRSRVITLYKNLLYMGRDYPMGYPYFRDKAHGAFNRNKNIKDKEKILELIGFGEYIMKELTALYSLKKYRTLKNRYYKDPEELPGSTRNTDSDKSKPPI